MIPARYQKPNAWPHTFAKKSGEYVGEFGTIWQNMQCTHCGLEYIQGKEPKPIGVCPERNDRDELIRLGRYDG